jgi:hypothetical protein
MTAITCPRLAYCAAARVAEVVATAAGPGTEGDGVNRLRDHAGRLADPVVQTFCSSLPSMPQPRVE